MKTETINKLKQLLESVHNVAVDDTLCHVKSSGFPKDFEYQEYIDGAWCTASDYWINKLNKILEDENSVDAQILKLKID